MALDGRWDELRHALISGVDAARRYAAVSIDMSAPSRLVLFVVAECLHDEALVKLNCRPSPGVARLLQQDQLPDVAWHAHTLELVADHRSPARDRLKVLLHSEYLRWSAEDELPRTTSSRDPVGPVTSRSIAIITFDLPAGGASVKMTIALPPERWEDGEGGGAEGGGDRVDEGGAVRAAGDEAPAAVVGASTGVPAAATGPPLVRPSAQSGSELGPLCVGRPPLGVSPPMGERLCVSYAWRNHPEACDKKNEFLIN